MMSRIQPRIVVAMLAILLVTLYIAGLRASVTATAAHSKSHGRYNYRQIVARSKVPAFELFGDSANWQMSAYSETVFDGNGSPIHVWNVVCTDSAGKDLGFFSWNSDSGDLERFSDRSLTPSKRTDGPMSSDEAVKEAKNWLRELNLTRQTSDWKLVARPAHRMNVWVIQFVGRSGAADLKIDVNSGKLLNYHLLHV